MSDDPKSSHLNVVVAAATQARDLGASVVGQGERPFRSSASSPAFRDALAIVETLARAGHVAYFAGGCVRDALLGKQPADYDVATSASPDRVRACFRRAQGVGESFGVMLVRQPSSHVEVATFRTDGDYADGRRPDRVEFSDEVHDARRRDFTINGMFFDPIAGHVIDHVGGQSDLAAGVVRAIGDPDARFAEDYLRILRAVRFSARLGFAIEPSTRAAIVKHAGKLTRIAPERVADELRRMLIDATASRAIGRCDELGISGVLFRRVDAQFASSPAPRSDAASLLAVVGVPASFSLALATIVVARLLASHVAPDDLVSTDAARRIDVALRETLRYSNDESAGVRAAISIHPLYGPDVPAVATLKRFLAKPYAGDAMRLFRAIAAATGVPERVVRIEQMIAGFGDQPIAPQPFVTGDDLTAMGFVPSPKFKRVLDAAYDEQLELRVTSPDAARAFALRLMSS